MKIQQEEITILFGGIFMLLGSIGIELTDRNIFWFIIILGLMILLKGIYCIMKRDST